MHVFFHQNEIPRAYAEAFGAHIASLLLEARSSSSWKAYNIKHTFFLFLMKSWICVWQALPTKPLVKSPVVDTLATDLEVFQVGLNCEWNCNLTGNFSIGAAGPWLWSYHPVETGLVWSSECFKNKHVANPFGRHNWMIQFVIFCGPVVWSRPGSGMVFYKKRPCVGFAKLLFFKRGPPLNGGSTNGV